MFSLGITDLLFYFSLCFINRVVFYLLNLLSYHFCLIIYFYLFSFLPLISFSNPLFCLPCGFWLSLKLAYYSWNWNAGKEKYNHSHKSHCWIKSLYFNILVTETKLGHKQRKWFHIIYPKAAWTWVPVRFATRKHLFPSLLPFLVPFFSFSIGWGMFHW